jgi:chemotaxis protein CheD
MSFHQIQVLGGESFATAETHILFKTVLGPCVSTCIFDPVLKIGGMNHFLLPVGGNRHSSGRDRFGDVAMRTLLKDMISLGGNPWRMQARLFGGKSSILHGTDVGAENSKFARRFLIENGIRLVESDLGGDIARWVTFNPTTGEATLTRQTSTPRPDNDSGDALRMRR